MKSERHIEERKPIWIALSDLYIDNELQDADFKYIATKIKESPYTFEEVKHIDKKEVFPILFSNLLSVAGNWTGFQEEWLVNEISKKIQKRTLVGSTFDRLKYYFFKGMNKEYWKKIESVYLALNP